MKRRPTIRISAILVLGFLLLATAGPMTAAGAQQGDRDQNFESDDDRDCDDLQYRTITNDCDYDDDPCDNDLGLRSRGDRDDCDDDPCDVDADNANRSVAEDCDYNPCDIVTEVADRTFTKDCQPETQPCDTLTNVADRTIAQDCQPEPAPCDIVTEATYRTITDGCDYNPCEIIIDVAFRTITDDCDYDPCDADNANRIVAEDCDAEPVETVLVCNLWEGTPYYYWKVHQLDRANADWWVANSNARIVATTSDCPTNPPVYLCAPYGDTEKLIVTDPWTANWYLASDLGMRKAVDGSCELTSNETETTDRETESTTEDIATDTAEPTLEESVEPQESSESQETAETDQGESGEELAAQGGTADPEAEVLGIAQERQELAQTGSEHLVITLAGVAMIALGAVLVQANRLRTVGH